MKSAHLGDGGAHCAMPFVSRCHDPTVVRHIGGDYLLCMLCDAYEGRNLVLME